MKRLFNTITAGALALAALPALAAGTATVRVGGDSQGGMKPVNFAWSDDGEVRMEAPGQGGYMLVRDGRAYAVRGSGADATVFDLTALREGRDGQAPTGASNELLELESLGESVTVAGMDGEVYRMRWRQEGEEKSGRVVLSDDPRAQSLSDAWGAMIRGMGADGGEDGIMAELKERGVGMLRIEGQYEVVEISGDSLAAERFELPAEPVDPRKMMQQQGGQ
ncbi:hypothetical protein KBTX_03639 [wastewater metagenome]|uniref:DUF4412 domain-containing protein n=2 Tax=unclassified sequences TaxID=12908 RepID=A0A5B8REK1_9ZZZZ|nr:hypothetical protein [Arhodomonas sp. KWT]QEA07290.1 hypothetical protein KBTEX_03639 [uncultured organism]